MTSAEKWTMGGSIAVLLVVALPLWGEFSEPGQWLWNIFLGGILVGLVAAALFLQRYFSANINEIGEARFDTRNKDESSS